MNLFWIIALPFTVALVVMQLRWVSFVLPRIGLLAWVRHPGQHEQYPEGTKAILRLALQNAEQDSVPGPIRIRVRGVGVAKDKLSVHGFCGPSNCTTLRWSGTDLMIEVSRMSPLKTLVFDVISLVDTDFDGEVEYESRFVDASWLAALFAKAGPKQAHEWHAQFGLSGHWSGSRATGPSIVALNLLFGISLYLVWFLQPVLQAIRTGGLDGLLAMYAGRYADVVWPPVVAAAASIAMFVGARPASPPTAQGYRDAVQLQIADKA